MFFQFVLHSHIVLAAVLSWNSKRLFGMASMWWEPMCIWMCAWLVWLFLRTTLRHLRSQTLSPSRCECMYSNRIAWVQIVHAAVAASSIVLPIQYHTAISKSQPWISFCADSRVLCVSLFVHFIGSVCARRKKNQFENIVFWIDEEATLTLTVNHVHYWLTSCLHTKVFLLVCVFFQFPYKWERGKSRTEGKKLWLFSCKLRGVINILAACNSSSARVNPCQPRFWINEQEKNTRRRKLRVWRLCNWLYKIQLSHRF